MVNYWGIFISFTPRVKKQDLVYFQKSNRLIDYKNTMDIRHIKTKVKHEGKQLNKPVLNQF